MTWRADCAICFYLSRMPWKTMFFDAGILGRMMTNLMLAVVLLLAAPATIIMFAAVLRVGPCWAANCWMKYGQYCER